MMICLILIRKYSIFYFICTMKNEYFDTYLVNKMAATNLV
ncbi:hypothetical protein KIS4809_3514 [Bacillus sp. ZZV12-4809]|nr:hypothetical protein KIS4809_3514 [Bacillus sp. ZZV12-4809]